MSKATMNETPTAQLATVEGAVGKDEPAMTKLPFHPATSGLGESPGHRVPLGNAAVSGAPVSASPLSDPSLPDKASESDGFAVQLTEEEWLEQTRLLAEHSNAVAVGDREKADGLLPFIIYPSYLLKATKKLLGADYIRKMGYNTVDADLVYGPGWLDEDDGGPVSIYAEELSR